MYNKTIDYLKQPGTVASWRQIKTGLIRGLSDPWATAAPYQVRSMAVKEACTTMSRCKLKYKQTGRINTASFRSKHASKQSFYLSKAAIDSKGFMKRTLGYMRYAEKLPETIEFDCRVVLDHGVWYVSIPVNMTIKVPKTKELFVALDPGVRTFQTFYSPTVAGSIGSRAWERLFKKCVALDDIKSKLASKSLRAKNRRQLKIASDRISRQIKFLRDELHWKTATFFAKSFHYIIIPEFSAQEMSKKSKRKIRSKTVRNMLTQAHSLFRERLKQQAAKYGSTVFVTSEAYTSKTCTRCGHEHTTLGGSEVFRCPSCGLIVSRDINGARNILLRAMPDLADVVLHRKY